MKCAYASHPLSPSILTIVSRLLGDLSRAKDIVQKLISHAPKLV